MVQGLPLLTVAGGSFPNRVGVSLYESLTLSSSFIDKIRYTFGVELENLTNLLICYSVKEFQDTAVRIVNKKSSDSINNILKLALRISNLERNGIFSSDRLAFIFYRSVLCMYESYLINLILSSGCNTRVLTFYNLIITDLY